MTQQRAGLVKMAPDKLRRRGEVNHRRRRLSKNAARASKDCVTFDSADHATDWGPEREFPFGSLSAPASEPVGLDPLREQRLASDTHTHEPHLGHAEHRMHLRQAPILLQARRIS